ncbi:hypothetical protein [Thioclava sp. NG1]|uniref:hypothetical protein n=1 Tax=Thioclava sp. NG1 TaxID=2182426 RepID=UPI0011B21EC9|nr:hypothetical protein [Thioclava sp. NG1]
MKWRDAHRGLNWPVAGLLTLICIGGVICLPTAATGIIGATAALIIGFVAYPWQKAQDRKNERHRELREFYFQTVSELVELRGSLARGPRLADGASQLDAAENWAGDILFKVNVIVSRVFLVSEEQKTIDAAMEMQRFTLDFLSGFMKFAEKEIGTGILGGAELREISAKYWQQTRQAYDAMQTKLETSFASEVHGREMKVEHSPFESDN